MEELKKKAAISRKITLITVCIQMFLLFPGYISAFGLPITLFNDMWFAVFVQWHGCQYSWLAEIVIIISAIYYILKDRQYVDHYNRYNEPIPYNINENTAIIALIPITLAAMFLAEPLFGF